MKRNGKRPMRLVVFLTVMSFLAGCSGADLTEFQANPSEVTPPDSPNWALGAPREAETKGAATHEVPVFATGPEELLDYLDTVALADERVEALAPTWTDSGLARAYVQRSAVIGFPDVISVEAIDLGVGDAGQRASFVIYSQSVYGHSDFGVNADRVQRWLDAVSEAAPVVSGR